MASTQWDIDPAHSHVTFSIRHMMISKVRGSFGRFSGTVRQTGPSLESSQVEATIETASIDTNEAKRDEHLRSADFFDAAKFPTLSFRSKRVSAKGKDHLQIAGELTMHGVTRDITLDVEVAGEAQKDPWGGVRLGATATTKLNRKDFGLTWNAALEAGGVLVGDEVNIVIDVELVKKA